MVAGVLVGTILDVARSAIVKKLEPQSTKSQKEALPGRAASAVEAIHEDPTIAIVNVKSLFSGPDFYVRVMTVIAAVLALIFGRDVLSPELQSNLLAVGVAVYGLYEFIRARRRTSISTSASVNMLEKPAQE